MYSIMDRYELFPENESVKSMIIEFVVSDFYIFLILFMFLYGIERFLLKRKTFEMKNRFDDFVDDKEFMEYLSVNGCHLLLGS